MAMQTSSTSTPPPQEVAASLQGYTVIVDKSTVPVGTAREVARVIRKSNPEADFDVASNPEFLARGFGDRRFHAPGSSGARR
jgi:UDPglucose 6-dehydrogenase